ncbi:hypothetical protein M3M35_05200 [Fructilactobacillus myrtifloralis]|uniref:WxL domain-containing protein n=1 Tax=Fructilactobacillus myrtifloralis TaxID=2940301 RepID=A0ABY5BNC1_9LACO|nr:hypothetical protein [Fructilactobacillus myrtifloralis]USS84706.1 hypothetical protein M3M35_05200 [Fructilactobacillus myrtifloralis]
MLKKLLVSSALTLVTIGSLLSSGGLLTHASNTLGIPAPPESGPSMSNFTYKDKPPAAVDYPNVQVVTDNNPGQSRGLWWKNKVDLTKPFTLKYYIYIASNDPSSAADGLTFTLQNDKDQIDNAKNGSVATGTNGESLGAYGDFRTPIFNFNPSNILDDAKEAYDNTHRIKNSLSLEFDPYFNSDYSDAFQLPSNANEKSHLAFTIPDKNHINVHNWSNGSRNYNLMGINHYGANKQWYDNLPNGSSSLKPYPNNRTSPNYGALSAPNLVGSSNSSDFNKARWEPVVYKWTPNSTGSYGSATATFGYPDSSKNTGGFPQLTLSSPRVNIAGTFGSDKTAYWGMTGSTGQKYMVSAISATDIPGNPGVSKTAADLTKLGKQGLRISKASGGKVVSKNAPGALMPDDSTLTSEELMRALPFDAQFTGDDGNKYPVFRNKIYDADVGDIFLYRADIYNYYDSIFNEKNPDIGNHWYNVHVKDSLPNQLRLLDGSKDVDLYFEDIPPIKKDTPSPTPQSHGFKAALVSDKFDDKNQKAVINTVSASGSNFADKTPVESSAVQVIPSGKTPGKPSFYINNQMQNVTQNMTDWSDTLNNVGDYDAINYRIPLYNFSQVPLTNGQYTFHLPSVKNNDPNSLKLQFEGQDIPYDASDTTKGLHYTMSDDDVTQSDGSTYKNAKKIVIKGLPTLDAYSTKNITANVNLGANQGKSFASTPTLTGQVNRSSETVSYYGNKEVYNLNSGSVQIAPNSFEYGTHAFFTENSYMLPQNTYSFDEAGNPVPTTPRIDPRRGYQAFSIKDTRKGAARKDFKVSLSQAKDNSQSAGRDQLKNADIIGANDSPFQLVFFDGKGAKHPLTPGNNDNVMVYSSGDDLPDLKSVVWNDRTGLKLNVRKTPNAPESGHQDYGATLNWTINSTDTP